MQPLPATPQYISLHFDAVWILAYTLSMFIKLKNADIRFYEQTKAFSDISTSIKGQTNGGIGGNFSRNFANGVNLTTEFRILGNINQQNEEGAIFNKKIGATNQTWLYEGFPRGRTNAIALGIHKHSEKYDGYFTYTFNAVSGVDRGGIADDSLFYKITPSETLSGLGDRGDNST